LNTLLQSALLGFLYAVFAPVAWALRVCGWRRDLVRKHLARCLPELGSAARGSIEAGAYRHLGQLAAELLTQRFLDRDGFTARMRLEQDAPLRAILAAQGRVLILSAHHSNWEWLLQRCATAFEQPLTAAYKPTRRAWVDDRLRGLRERLGCRMVKAQELVPHLLAQRGQVRLLAMLADQSPAAGRDQQSWLEFFGQPTSFYGGPGWIGAKLGYTVVFAAMHRERRGHYVVRFIELAAAGSRKEPDQILAAYARTLEQHVREHPAEYLWIYNRWKREKPLYG
jgi:Kdo2-lipid IVA lauroyltransferase/acyltransferase